MWRMQPEKIEITMRDENFNLVTETFTGIHGLSITTTLSPCGMSETEVSFSALKSSLQGNVKTFRVKAEDLERLEEDVLNYDDVLKPLPVKELEEDQWVIKW